MQFLKNRYDCFLRFRETVLYSKLKLFSKKCWKILNSKFLVVAVIIGILFSGGASIVNKANADEDNYKFGTVYQYYLLSEQGKHIASGASEKKIHVIGSIGNSGVEGSFSYGDIADSGSSKDNSAENFASMMATYSKFNYIATSQQTMMEILSRIGRFFMGVVLLICGFMYDIFSVIIFAIPALLAKLNVIPLIASWVSNTNVIGKNTLADSLQKNFGVSSSNVQFFITIIISVLSIFILISVYQYLGKGAKNLNQKARNKLTGRILSMVCVPVGFALSAMLISDAVGIINAQNKDTQKSSSIYGTYLVDVENWAEHSNFAPDGHTRTTSAVMKPNSSDGYVDNRFVPYDSKSNDRVKSINGDSPYFKDDGSGVSFSNSSVALQYLKGDTFTADQYIQYLGTKKAQQNKDFGAYYNFAQRFTGTKYKGKSDNEILNTDSAFWPSHPDGDGIYMYSNHQAQDDDWNYKKAIDDYSKKSSPSRVWRERFIYGTKSSGDKLKDYYDNVPPSNEQVRNAVGTGTSDNSYSLSDQSMYLALSTNFNNTGGQYYLGGPARGIQSAGLFDSSRVKYYSFSMIGIPFVSAIGATSKVLFTLTIWIVAVMALLSVGLVSMNVKPVSAAFKWMLMGDQEYGIAYMIYSVGVVGTMIVFAIVTRLMTDVGNAIPTLLGSLVSSISNVGVNTKATASATLMAHSLSPIAMGLITAVFMWAIKHNVKNIRDGLMYVFQAPWETALGYGLFYERQAVGTQGRGAKREGNRYRKEHEDFGQRMVGKMRGSLGFDDAGAKEGAKNFGRDVLDTGRFLKNAPQNLKNGKNKLANMFHDDDKESGLKPDEIARRQGLSGVTEAMANNEPMSDEAKRKQDEALNAMRDYNEDPTDRNLDNVKDKLQAYRDQMEKDGATPQQLAQIDRAIREFEGKTNPDGIDVERKNQGRETDKVLLDTDTNGIPNGQELKDNARDAVAQFTNDPTDANLARSISSVQALRDQMEANGATPEQLKPLDEQLDKLKALQGQKVDVMGQLGGVEGLEDMDAQLKDVDVSGVKNGAELKQNARDQLASLRVDDSPEQVKKTIDGVQRLRDAMVKSGATQAELEPIDKQLAQLKGLKTPEVDIQGKLGGIEGMENMRRQLDDINLDSTLDGNQLKQTAQNALSDLQIEPTEANVDKSIGSIKAMRNAMANNGASSAQLGKLDKQIAQLENLKTPSIDFTGSTNGIKGLNTSLRQQVESAMNNAVAHPTIDNFRNAQNQLDNLKNVSGIKLDTKDLQNLEATKVKLGNAELSSIAGNNLRQVVGDTPQVRETVKNITNYANHGSIEDFMKAQHGMANLQQQAYNNGNTQMANELGRQMAQFGRQSVTATTNQSAQRIQTELGQNATRSITQALDSYGKNPTQTNFGQVQQAMTSAINDANKDGDNQTNRLLREQLNKMSRTNAGYVNSNFANEVREALGEYSQNNSIQPLLQKLDGSRTTNDRLNITKQITQAMKQSKGAGMQSIDTNRLTEAVRNIKQNPINSVNPTTNPKA